MNIADSKSEPTLHREPKSRETLQRAFDLCVRKTRVNIHDLAAQPGTWSNAVDGDYSKWNEDFYELGNWTSSFFTGNLIWSLGAPVASISE